MKKLLVLALALVLTLGIATMASAATFAGSVGGEYQITYAPDAPGFSDENPIGPFDDSVGARFKSYVVGTVEDKDTNTWAKIGCLIKVWNFAPNAEVDTDLIDSNSDGTGDAAGVKINNINSVFEAGIKQIAGSKIDAWYTNDENGNTKRGMVPLTTPWFKFGGDPGFSDGRGDVLGVDYNGDQATVNFIYGFNKGAAEDNLMIGAATFKFEGGSVWAGYRANYDTSTQMGVGAEFKAGFGTIKADYITNAPVDGSDADDTSYIQAEILLLDNKLDITVNVDENVYFKNDGGTGFGIVYNITDKLYVGGKSLTASKASDEASDLTNAYVGFVYGIFDTRIGSAQVGKDGDSFVYITSHVGMW